MQMLPLLGKALKDDEIIDILERYGVEVVYSFDRLHENSPDIYWAPIKSAGIELRFNEHQLLEAIFCYVSPREGFSAASTETIGVPVFASFALAEQACLRNGVNYQVSAPPGHWLKVLGSGYDTHYAFDGGCLSMVTLMQSSRGEA